VKKEKIEFDLVVLAYVSVHLELDDGLNELVKRLYG